MIGRTGSLCVVMLALLAAGCQSEPLVPFTPEPASRPSNARVYVYWPGQAWREKAGKAVELQLDGIPVGILRYKRYISLDIPYGVHEFKVTGDSEDAQWDGPEKAFEIRIKRGEVRYVRFLVKYDQHNMDWSQLGMDFVVQLLPRDPKLARIEMAKLEPSEQPEPAD